MKITYWKIDSDGYWIGYAQFEEGTAPSDYIGGDEPPWEDGYRVKWDGTNWIKEAL